MWSLQVVQQLLSRLATGNDQQRIIAAHTLSHLLETEEAKYRCLVGDPHINPNLRSHYTIGKVLAVIKVRQQALLTMGPSPCRPVAWVECAMVCCVCQLHKGAGQQHCSVCIGDKVERLVLEEAEVLMAGVGCLSRLHPMLVGRRAGAPHQQCSMSAAIQHGSSNNAPPNLTFSLILTYSHLSSLTRPAVLWPVVLCCAVQDDEDTYDAVVDTWITARGASLEQQVAGLRLLHACLDCWLFQYPLTGEHPVVVQ